MDDKHEKPIRPKYGFILENKNYYVTRDNKIINVEKFKDQCKHANITDWLTELKKL
jgi:hypothetical protein